jgi:hypothetical protein
MQSRQGSRSSRQTLSTTLTREYEDRLDWLENRGAAAPLSRRQVEILLKLAVWASALTVAIAKCTGTRSLLR